MVIVAMAFFQQRSQLIRARHDVRADLGEHRSTLCIGVIIVTAAAYVFFR